MDWWYLRPSYHNKHYAFCIAARTVVKIGNLNTGTIILEKEQKKKKKENNTVELEIKDDTFESWVASTFILRKIKNKKLKQETCCYFNFYTKWVI